MAGGDDFAESLALDDPSATADGTPLLTVLRDAVQAGDAWVVLAISTDQERFRLSTEPARSPLITSNTCEGTGLRVPMNVTVTGEEVYPALVDVTERWNGWLSPHLTLDAVRQLAADTQATAAEYGHNCVDTVHVIDGGENEEGETDAIVVHVRWQYFGSEGCASIVPRQDDGRYRIGGWEWTWSAVEPDTGNGARDN